MKKLYFLLLTLILAASCNQQKFQEVEGDELQTRICTLDNGLKIYMSVNHAQPRIQTYIAVHSGSRNEPADATGLAHYLEHMMFKGSTSFGTTNYEKEKPLLDRIEALYEAYGKTRESGKRKAIYHQIDSVSQLASQYFISNEYDKMMAHIGSEGSNAWTDLDETVYQEDIPSNQIENWAMVQSDRFQNMVLRGFHTELEAVYEEYNMGLNSDWDKLSDTVMGALFPTHPYRRGVIGLGEHLKNPSLRHIEEFFHQYYVPNDIAICLSGDFDPDEMVNILQKHFGRWKRNETLKQPVFPKQKPLTKPIRKEIITPNPEAIFITWSTDKASSLESDTLALLEQVLSNGKAGLFDTDIMQKQRAVEAGVQNMGMHDYGIFMLMGHPNPGQTLDQLFKILMFEMDKVRQGKFSADLIKGAITQMKLHNQEQFTSNEYRAQQFVHAFTLDIPWQQEAQKMERISKITKADLQKFVKRHFRSNNYVVVYKRQGEDPNNRYVEKPKITPIEGNRDSVSAFAKGIFQSKITPIEPKFIDFTADMAQSKVGQLPMLYTHNTENRLFTLTFELDYGVTADRRLTLAPEYVNLLGTGRLTAQQIAEQFYLLGCDMSIDAMNATTRVILHGLSENMQPALQLMERLLQSPKTDNAAFAQMIRNQLKMRQMHLDDFDSWSHELTPYLLFQNPSAKTYSNKELQVLKARDITDCLSQLLSHRHTIEYNGPMSAEDVAGVLKKLHLRQNYIEPLAKNLPAQILTGNNQVYIMPYHGTQSFIMRRYSCPGVKPKVKDLAINELYNEYFGGGMNTIVFQEMREKRSLCYHASAISIMPDRDQGSYNYFNTDIQSQNDKLSDALAVFTDITNDMPLSEKSFQISKQSLITSLRTNRTASWDIIPLYMYAKRLGLTEDHNHNIADPHRIIYNNVQRLTLTDLKTYQRSRIKAQCYHTIIAGDPEALDKTVLSRYGTVSTITPNKVMGF